MRNTTDVTDGKPIAVFLQSISGVRAVNPWVAFYIHGRKREVLFFYFVPVLFFCSLSQLVVSAINHLFAFYDIH
jgi:hypothetical protein